MKKNLLDETPHPKAKVEVDPLDDGKFFQYFKKELYLYLIYDNSAYSANEGPPIQIRQLMQLNYETMSYSPIIYLSDYWCLKKDMVLVNDTLLDLNLTLHFNTYSLNYMIMQK